MNVICLQEDAFFELVRQVVEKLKENDPKKEDEWVDGEQAMKILNCKKTKLQALRTNGEIEYSQPSRKIIIYHRPSLIGYYS